MCEYGYLQLILHAANLLRSLVNLRSYSKIVVIYVTSVDVNIWESFLTYIKCHPNPYNPKIFF